MTPVPRRRWLAPARWVARAIVRLAGGIPDSEDERRRARLHRLIKERVVSIGAHTYGAPDVHAWRDDSGRPIGESVTIGRYCSIAEGVTIFASGEHHTEWISTFPFRVAWRLPDAWHDGHPASKGPIDIGNDVWIAYGATILSGVTIGDGAVVAANSTVTKDVQPYAIVAGNPAVEIGRRFPQTDIEFLLSIRWWDWPDDEVARAVDVLCSGDLDALREIANRRGPQV